MADEYWIDPTPKFQPQAWSHVSGPSYWDSIVRSDGRVGGWTAIGADDYVIVPKFGNVGGPVRRHRHSRYYSSPQYWVPPLYYTGIDFSDVAVNSSPSDPTDIPDAWEAGWKKKDSVGHPVDIMLHGEVSGNFDAPAGWYRPATDAIAVWRKKYGSMPTPAQQVQLAMQIALIKSAIGKADELMFEHHHMVLEYLINHKVLPSGYPNDTGYNAQLIRNARTRVDQHVAKYHADHPSNVFGDIAGAIGDAVKFAGAPITGLASLVKDVPLLGPVLNAAVALDPGQQIGNISSAVGRGERLDKAILNEGRKTIAAVKEVAPYVTTVISFVPGVGTGIAAAIAAGTALAEGRSISDAVIDGLRNAVPGGALGKTAFNAALAIAHGDSISDVALNTVKNTLPPAAQRAVDTAVAAANGKNVREAVLQAVRANLPPAAQKALEVGVATAIGRNAQSSVAKAVSTPQSINKLANMKPPLALKPLQPKSADAKKGFDVAVNMLQHRAVTPTAMTAVRAKLKPNEQQGFDQGVKAVRNVFTQATHSTLVRGGIVSRANWKPVGKNDKGSVPGRLVKDGKITFGYYARA